MNILKQYADNNGYNYQELLSDFYSSPKQEQDMFLAQAGGQMQQQAPQQEQGGQDQIMQIIQAYAQLTGEDPEAIIQQLQQLPPEEQQAAVEEMVQALQQQQQAQAGGRYGLKKKSIPVTTEGYRQYDPASTPELIVPSGNISMKGINYPIRATDADSGEYLGIMQPQQEYNFSAKNILEQPIYAQRAGQVESTSVSKKLVPKKFLKHNFETLKKVLQDESGIDLKNIKDKKSLVNFVKSFSYNGDKTLTRYLPAVESLESKTTEKTVEIPSASFSETYLNEFRKVKAGNKLKENGMFDNKPDVAEGVKNLTSAVSDNVGLGPKSKQLISDTKNYFKQNNKPLYNLNPNTKEGADNIQQLKNFAGGVMQQTVRPGSKYPKAAEGTYGLPSQKSKNLKVDGKNRSYNLTWDRDYAPDGASLYQDEDGNRWRKEKDGSVKIIWRPGDGGSTSSKKPLVKSKGSVGPKKPVATATTPKLNFMPKDTDLTEEEIGEMAKNIPGTITPNTNARNITLDNVGGEKNWLGKDSITTVGSAASPTPAGKNPQYKFNTRNLLQGLVAQSNVAKAFQPIALPFRQHVSLEAPQAKFIDENVVLAPIMQAYEKTVANINPNSTTGMAFKSNLFGKLTETIPQVLNDVNTKNQEIYAANQTSTANARNREQEYNIGADNTAYQSMLQSSAARDAGISQALQDVANLQTSVNEENARIDGYMIENPFMSEKSSFLDKMFGNRTLEMDPEYRKIYKVNKMAKLQEEKTKTKAKTATA